MRRILPAVWLRSGALLQGAAVATVLLWAGGAAAKDESIAGPDEYTTIAPQPTTAPSKFDVGFGLSFTTDYVTKGISQTDSSPAIQGYIEPSYGIYYVNVWSSNVDFGDDFRGTEIDVLGGIRPEFGPLSLNVGWVHYFYVPENVSPAYGELFAKADYNFDDKFTVVTQLFFAPDFNQSGKTATFIAGGVKVPLPHDFKAYGGVGYQFFEDDNAFEDLAWTAGLSYTWKELTFDVRYWDTDLADNECVVRSGFADGCEARVVGTISIDLTASGLRERFGSH